MNLADYSDTGDEFLKSIFCLPCDTSFDEKETCMKGNFIFHTYHGNLNERKIIQSMKTIKDQECIILCFY